MITGIRVGHWTGAGTGVTVVLCPPETIGSVEIRGGAPATRETALLEPGRSVESVDAVVLTGGSAFGLAAADGVMAWLAERGRGFPTRGGPVPIVPTAAIFDLVEGGAERPGPQEGRLAADAAECSDGTFPTGRVGAGRGATVGKWRGGEYAVPGGLGATSVSVGDSTVSVIAVVNAVGDVVDADGRILAGSTAPPDAAAFPVPQPFEATTLVVLATDARLTKAECHLLAQSGHQGLARSIHPSHTRFDGDLVIALATGSAGSEQEDRTRVDRLRMTATDVVADAVRNAVRQT